ncbi:cyclopropane-fatty-acyl-phospholipid synthase family protein [Roseibium sp. RKSG952]|uniref:SAM-dependent methyltransferase n=1 Tax=Roseibium sp. RKSG952 TaxID=2529384 RepID=UPI0012BC412C|nr:cyclopropane-fatty-acyl-phospholipid synthase family protein [Roseibium sp. RKSG952]MTH95895.1 class I SAM-dependent methyltransferase [Roseibium sp. RKSG952]
MRLLSSLLKSYIQKGRLRLIGPTGEINEIGSGLDGPTVTVRLHDRKLPLAMVLNLEMAGSEAFLDGRLTVEEGSTIYDLLYLLASNNMGALSDAPSRGLTRLRELIQRALDRHNTIRRAKKQARYHYDLSTDLFRLFLDDGLNYSCAYYRSPEDTLEQAQDAKLNHLIAKLDLERGMEVLEIGGGWGSLAIRMAQQGAKVTSLNVSPEQVKIAEQRVREAGVENRVKFVLKDYREFQGSFDRVISVGMMEHVGIGYLEKYFAKVHEVLKEDGFAVIHSIGRMTPPGVTTGFIKKYIFPGGNIPALSEVLGITEDQGIWVDDIEILRLHYYYTIRDWRLRFEKNRAKAAELYDERFCRMWELYLAGVELSFLFGANMVFQLILSRKRDAVPIIRDFIVDNERKLNVELERVG